MKTTDHPTFSIIIVNYNDKKHLKNCLESVLKNSYQKYEIIIVDNHSTDGSLKLINSYYKTKKNIHTISLDKNYGPSKARNEGVKTARGKYLCFLDNDTEVDKHFLIESYKLFSRDKNIGCLQAKLLLYEDKNKYDYAGEYINQYGFLVQRAKKGEIDHGQYDQEVEILAAKSAGMFIRQDVFKKIGGFDDDYFIYLEETDLGWRSWLTGFKVVFCPNSKVYHHFSATISVLGSEKSVFNVRFHGTKNYILTLLKNLETKNLLPILLKHLFIWVGLSFFLFLTLKPKPAIYILKAIFWNLQELQLNLKKRNLIQKSRKIDDDQLFKLLLKKQNLNQKIAQYFSH